MQTYWKGLSSVSQESREPGLKRNWHQETPSLRSRRRGTVSRASSKAGLAPAAPDSWVSLLRGHVLGRSHCTGLVWTPWASTWPGVGGSKPGGPSAHSSILHVGGCPEGGTSRGPVHWPRCSLFSFGLVATSSREG